MGLSMRSEPRRVDYLGGKGATGYTDPMNEPQTDDESEVPDSRRGALIGFGVVLLLIVGGLVLSHLLRATAQVQDCVMSGRTNCAPIDTSSSENHGSN